MPTQLDMEFVEAIRKNNKACSAGFETLVNEVLRLESYCGKLEQEGEDLRAALNNLREAQKAYMSDRGNSELGKKVGEMAAAADKVLNK